MDVTDIAFPHLGIYLHNVPKTFSVFGFEIALYGVIIACGMLLGVTLAAQMAKWNHFSPDYIWDFAVYAIIFGIMGARIYYVVFAWDKYKDDLVSVFNIRNGGLAIYGGVIAGIITLFVFCKIKKVKPLQFADAVMIGLVLGQLMGRWGNFTNREAFGQYTDGLFAMRLPIAAVRANDISQSIADHIVDGTNYIQVHPTFLYESCWNVVLIIILILVTRHKKFDGQIFFLYLGGYGVGRFIIEGLRTDQLLIPHTQIAISQVVAITLLVVCVIGHIVCMKGIPQKSNTKAENKSIEN